MFAETDAKHPFVEEEQMMPFLPVVRVKSVEEGIEHALEAEHNYKHPPALFIRIDVENMTASGRKALDTTRRKKTARAWPVWAWAAKAI